MDSIGARPRVSIRLRLLGMIGVSMSLLFGLLSLLMYLNVRHQVSVTLDDRLAASARMVAELMSTPGLASLHDVQLEAAERRSDPLGGVACEVSVVNGKSGKSGKTVPTTLARTPGSPSIDGIPAGFSSHLYNGVRWRTYVLLSGNLRIVTSDRVETRDALLHHIAIAAAIPFAIALLGALSVLWIGVARGLAPLEAIRRVLDKRSANDARPLHFQEVPAELTPLVRTIQQLLERTRHAMHQERRFSDDAAHELRTPLAAVKVHLQVVKLALLRPNGADEVLRAAQRAELGVQRMQHVLDHLLALARIDAHESDGALSNALDVRRAIAFALDDLGEDLDRTRIDIDIDLENEPSLAIAVPEGLVVAALRNLIDNALRYSPDTSPVEIRVDRADADHIRFVVLDEGAGLSDEESAKAIERFWRGRSTTMGSGLGLSIVATIAARFHAQFSLRRRTDGTAGPNGDKTGMEARLTVRSTPFTQR